MEDHGELIHPGPRHKALFLSQYFRKRSYDTQSFQNNELHFPIELRLTGLLWLWHACQKSETLNHELWGVIPDKQGIAADCALGFLRCCFLQSWSKEIQKADRTRSSDILDIVGNTIDATNNPQPVPSALSSVRGSTHFRKLLGQFVA